jgi:hypothetical protein
MCFNTILNEIYLAPLEDAGMAKEVAAAVRGGWFFRLGKAYWAAFGQNLLEFLHWATILLLEKVKYNFKNCSKLQF